MRDTCFDLSRSHFPVGCPSTPPNASNARLIDLQVRTYIRPCESDVLLYSHYLTMTDDQKKTVLVVGAGSVGTIAALNLEVGGLASVTVALRSNYKTVKEQGYTIESCDHGSSKGFRPSVGSYDTSRAMSTASNPPQSATPSQTLSPRAFRRTTISLSALRAYQTLDPHHST